MKTGWFSWRGVMAQYFQPWAWKHIKTAWPKEHKRKLSGYEVRIPWEGISLGDLVFGIRAVLRGLETPNMPAGPRLTAFFAMSKAEVEAFLAVEMLARCD